MQTYLSDLVFANEAMTIEECRDKVQGIIEFAEGQGMTLIDGSTHIARERDPVETLAYSVGSVFRNQKAKDLFSTAR